MKSIIVFSIMTAAAIGAALAQASGSLAQPPDARAEAVVTGGALLILAALLRRGVANKRQ